MTEERSLGQIAYEAYVEEGLISNIPYHTEIDEESVRNFVKVFMAKKELRWDAMTKENQAMWEKAARAVEQEVWRKI